MTGFLLTGITYGIYMHQLGFSFWYPMLMATTIFGSSVEFVVAQLLCTQVDLWGVFIIVLIINARHLFYGVAMLKPYDTKGFKKLFLIFGMCDESFAINYTTDIPSQINQKYFYIYVTALNYFYWVLGSTLGGLFGHLIPLPGEGLSFAMTALFIVLFMEQFFSRGSRQSALNWLIGNRC